MRSRLAPLVLGLGLVSSLGCSDRPTGVSGDLPGAQFDAGPIEVGPKPTVDAGEGEDARPIVDGYPAGPYGRGAGAVFPNLAFDGYGEGSTTWAKVRLGDFFDPTGSRGIRAILVVVAAEWCAECVNEAKWIPGAYDSVYRAKGARFLTGVIHDRDRKPANQLVVDRWRDTFGIDFAIVADPTMSLLPTEGGAIALPRNYVIDPRTMRVVKVLDAEQPPPSIPALDALIVTNGG